MKKHATLEDYMALGADIRLLRALLIKMVSNKMLLLSESSTLSRCLDMIDNFKGDQENKMLDAYPDLSNDYLRIFYGPVNREPEDENVDKVVIELAKKTAEDLFKR